MGFVSRIARIDEQGTRNGSGARPREGEWRDLGMPVLTVVVWAGAVGLAVPGGPGASPLHQRVGLGVVVAHGGAGQEQQQHGRDGHRSKRAHYCLVW